VAASGTIPAVASQVRRSRDLSALRASRRLSIRSSAEVIRTAAPASRGARHRSQGIVPCRAPDRGIGRGCRRGAEDDGRDPRPARRGALGAGWDAHRERPLRRGGVGRDLRGPRPRPRGSDPPRAGVRSGQLIAADCRQGTARGRSSIASRTSCSESVVGEPGEAGQVPRLDRRLAVARAGAAQEVSSGWMLDGAWPVFPNRARLRGFRCSPERWTQSSGPCVRRRGGALPT
jgi:hypothetical protein